MGEDADNSSKWSITPDGENCVLAVVRTCGHTTRYIYAAEEYARREVPDLLASKCTMCAAVDRLPKPGGLKNTA